MQNSLIYSQLLESSSDSDDDFVLNYLMKRKREDDNLLDVIVKKYMPQSKVCTENDFDDVVNKYNEEEFRRHFRISKSLFVSLVDKFENSATYKNMRVDVRGISPSVHVAVFLWFAGHEACAFRDLADRFNLALSSVNSVITRIITFLSNMAKDAFKWPNDERKEECSTYFRSKCGFPAVIGCIGSTNIAIDPPIERKDDYTDRKGNTSLILQAVCDEKRKFIDMFVGYPGSCHDSWVLKNSRLYAQLEECCGDYYLLGDIAYPCLKNLITPYKDNGDLTDTQKQFNTQLDNVRIEIEHSFGILKQRFRQLNYCKLRGDERICHFIRACCVLHNVANEDDLKFILEAEQETPLPHDQSVEETGINLRNQICSELQTQTSIRRNL